VIIDTNVLTTPHLAALKAAGVKTIIRYIRPVGDGGSAAVHPAEARAIASHGLNLSLVVEGAGNLASSFSAATGTRDARKAISWAPGVGMPMKKGCVIWFAVDFDASRSQINSRILPYFKSIRAVFKDFAKVGVYASGSVCQAVLESGLADESWLAGSMGWSGSHAYSAANAWTLRQHLPHNVAGIDADANDWNPKKPMGEFVPFAQPNTSTDLPVADDDVKWAQQVFNKLGTVDPPLAEDGIEGSLTRAAIIEWQKTHDLAEDGIIGPLTKASIEQAYDKDPTTHEPAGADATVATVNTPDPVPAPANVPEPHDSAWALKHLETLGYTGTDAVKNFKEAQHMTVNNDIDVELIAVLESYVA
jgi:peptidoglycan hydrolase-like protein with peptidoglycan-binding domain